MYKLKKQFMISCSHRLYNNHMATCENKKIYGKCSFSPSHGHNYRIILNLKSKDLSNGMIMNFSEIKKIFLKEIDEVLSRKQ